MNNKRIFLAINFNEQKKFLNTVRMVSRVFNNLKIAYSMLKRKRIALSFHHAEGIKLPVKIARNLSGQFCDK
jgi:hypothetical protein